MQINKEADFVLKGNKVLHPPVRTDGLELYYDTKGKKNTDTYKNRMLDMSGNDRHGELQNFNYKNLSGYQEDSELVFDGINDKLIRPETDEIEVVSATKNLLNGQDSSIGRLNHQTGASFEFGRRNGGHATNKPIPIKPNTSYVLTLKGDSWDGWLTLYDKDLRVTRYLGPNSAFTTESNEVYAGVYTTDSELSLEGAQLEEGSAATPYVPYFPSIRGTYQINNNIISYDGDTVRWVKDGKVMERKGINLIQNGNFWNGTTGWSSSVSIKSMVAQLGTLRVNRVSDGGGGAFGAYVGGKGQGLKYISVEFRSSKLRNPHVRLGSSTVRDAVVDDGQWHRAELITSYEGIIRFYADTEGGGYYELRNAQAINLTATFGAGNEPTLEEIQAEPDKWQWLPNPLDLVEAKELKGNILGDMEDIIDDHTRDEQSGIEVFTDKADDSLVRVEVDGKSVGGGSGKNLILNSDFQKKPVSYANRFNELERGYNYFEFKTMPSANTGPIFMFSEPLKSGVQYTLSFDIHSETGKPLNYINMRRGASHTSAGGSMGGLPTQDLTAGWNTVSINFSGSTDINGIWIGTRLPEEERYIIKNLQLEEGSTATAYEPPAPTPDYPIEIHSLNDFDVVSSVGKRNLLKNSNFRDGGEHWTTFSNPLYEIKDNIVLSGGESTYVKLRQNLGQSIVPGDVYYARAEVRALSDFYQLQFQLGSAHYWNNSFGRTTPIKDEWIILSGIIEAGSFDNYTFAITTDNRSSYDSPLWETKREVQLINLTATFGRGNEPSKEEADELFRAWTPAPEDIAENDNHPLIDKISLLLSEPLRSVGDVKDRLFRDSDGLWKIEWNIANKGIEDMQSVATYSGSNEYHFDGGVAFLIYYPNNQRSISTTDILSSHFKKTGSNNYNAPSSEVNTIHQLDWTRLSIRVSESAIGVTYANTSQEKVTAFRGWAKDNNVRVQYILNEPTIETLNQELQDKLNNLRSFQDSNYVYTIIND